MTRRTGWRAAFPALALVLAGASPPERGEISIGISATGDADLAVAAALREARRARQDQPGAPTAVIFPAGVYRLSRPVVIDRALAGGGAFSLEAEKGATVRLIGSRQLRPEEQIVIPDQLAAKVSPVCRGRLIGFRLTPDQQVSLMRSVTAGGRGAMSAPPAIFEGSTTLAIARWPVAGFHEGDRRSSRGGYSLALPPDRASAWRNERFLWTGGYWSQDYQYELRPFAVGVGLEGRVTAPEGAPQTAKRARYAVFNAPSSLQPGSYVFDVDRALVAICPRGDGADLEMAVTPTLLRVNEARNLKVSGLSFQRTTSDAIVIDRSQDVTIEDSLVGEASGRGIAVTEGVRNVIRRTVVHRTGETGISLSGGQRGNLNPGRNAVLDSVVVDFGQWSRSYRPAVMLSGVGNQVKGLFVAGGAHAGLILHGNNHLVEDNEITQVVTDEGDAGAIYAGRDWTQQGTIIRRNYLHDVGLKSPRAGSAWQTGVYLDDFASGYRVEGNLFVRVSQPVFVGGGRENTIVGNTFIDSWPAAIKVDSRGAGWAASMVTNPTSALRKAFAAAPVTSEAYRRAYPRLADMLQDEPALPKYLVIAGNRFFQTQPYDIVAPAASNRIEAPAVVRSRPRCDAQAGALDRRARLATLRYYAAVSVRLAQYPMGCR